MSERKSTRLILIGLIAVTVIAATAVYYRCARASPTPAKPWTRPSPANKLQSLAELDGKAPTNRKLDVQTWNTAEGAKVLFVEAHELPMFDMRLIFAAGSSQDGDAPGPGADDQRHAQRRRGRQGCRRRSPRALKAWVQTLAMAPTATWPLAVVAQPERQRISAKPALKLFCRSASASRRSRPTRWRASRTRCSPVSNTRNRTPANWPALN